REPRVRRGLPGVPRGRVSSSSSSSSSSTASIREIEEDELARWVAVVNATEREPGREERMIADFLDWKRQAPLTVWLLGEEAGAAVGAGRLTPGWHSPPGVARADVRVVPAARGRGIGSALLDERQRRAEVLG